MTPSTVGHRHAVGIHRRELLQVGFSGLLGVGLPSGVNLPTYLVEGPLNWPGQHAGILGPRHDPWQVTRDPSARDFRMDNLTLAPGLTVDQLGNRLSLLDEVNRQQEWLANSADGR